MTRRLGTSITETARLVRCSRSAVVSIHAKWINDGDTSNGRQGVRRPRVKEKRTSESAALGKAKSAPDSPIQCRFKRTCFETVQRTLGYGAMQQTSHSCASVDQASSSTTPTVSPGTSRLDHG
ncbi:hypothetical protein AVEN_84945-1 [Araneus ventricosus]|uniref:Transposase Tc1-like domain-containing protein n=1 Tax=Araneus ventricosus TaxID=182803 RepID=A0A4Y2BYF6_ARAVE|nr:hypothetical protein AVEN_84945-1 [Araneus ventricosus]